MSNETKPEKQLLSVQDLRDITGFSVRKLWAMRDAGHLPPALKIGGSVRWKLHGKDSVSEWLESGCPSCRPVRSTRGGR